MCKVLVSTVVTLFCVSFARAEAASSATSTSNLSIASIASPDLGSARRFTVTIPAASEVPVELLSGMHSRISHVGDPVRARVTEGVYVNGRLAVPRDSLLDGRITWVRAAGRARRSGELAFRFEGISFPDGRAEPASLTVERLDRRQVWNCRLDAEGRLIGARPSKKLLALGFVGFAGAALPATRLAGAMAFKVLLPVGSAAWVGYELVWPRGSEINVAPDSRCLLRLNYPLTIVMGW